MWIVLNSTKSQDQGSGLFVRDDMAWHMNAMGVDNVGFLPAEDPAMSFSVVITANV